MRPSLFFYYNIICVGGGSNSQLGLEIYINYHGTILLWQIKIFISRREKYIKYIYNFF